MEKWRLAHANKEHSQDGNAGLSPKVVPTRLEKRLCMIVSAPSCLDGLQPKVLGALPVWSRGRGLEDWLSSPSNEEVGEDNLDLVIQPGLNLLSSRPGDRRAGTGLRFTATFPAFVPWFHHLSTGNLG